MHENSNSSCDSNIKISYNGNKCGKDPSWLYGRCNHMQSVCLTTNVVNLNPVHGEVYSKQLYVIKFAGDLRQVGGFLRFPQPLKLTTTI
jgi:hypothetical protein